MPRRVGMVCAGLSALILAAHFLRAGAIPGVLLSLGLPFLLLVGRPWATRVVQLGLGLGAAEWLYTLGVIAAQRRAVGAPWTRMALILGSVSLFTLLSALLLQPKKNHHPLAAELPARKESP